MAAKKKGGSSAPESVREELLRVTKVKPTDGESDVDLATRVAEGVNALQDADYDTLSKAAIKWYEKTVDEVKAGKAPPKFPPRDEGTKPAESEPAPETREESNAAEAALGDGSEGKGDSAPEPVPKKGAKSGGKSAAKSTTKKGDDMAAKKKAGAKKPAAAKSTKKSGAKKATTAAPATKAAPQKESMALRVRKIVVQAPSIEFEDLVKKLGEKHDVGGHAWNIYNHAKQVMDLVELYRK